MGLTSCRQHHINPILIFFVPFESQLQAALNEPIFGICNSTLEDTERENPNLATEPFSECFSRHFLCFIKFILENLNFKFIKFIIIF